MSRPVPRHIDMPNRVPEFVITYLIVFYTTQFLFNQAMVSIVAVFLSLYGMYKYTLDKPEGLMMRKIYRYVQIGKMRPTPRIVKIFEI